MALTDVKSEQIQSSVALAGSPTTTTQSASDNSTKIATTAYVETAVANLVASAPAALNTLDELAAALNDDASFSTTVTNSIATKLPLAGGTMSGALNMGSQNITNAGTIAGTLTTAAQTNITSVGTLSALAVNSGTTNTAATFTSSDAGAGINLTDDSGTSTLQTYGANLRIGVDEAGAVSSSAIQFRVDGSTKATLNSLGNLGIGTSSPVNNGTNSTGLTIDGTGNYQNLVLQKSGVSQFMIYLNGPSGTFIDQITADPMMFLTSDTERMRIDASGNVLIGATTSSLPSSGTPGLEVAGSGFAGMAAVTRFDNNAYGPSLFLVKSRAANASSHTIVANNDNLGAINWTPDDGTNRDTYAASIAAKVDGTPGANDMPARLEFMTTANAAATPTERMRIDSNGDVGIGADGIANGGGNRLAIDTAVNAAPVTSGTTQTGGALRLRGGDNAVLDFGLNSVNTWIQATDKVNLANGYNIALNPNGGKVGVGIDNPYAQFGVYRNQTDPYTAGSFLDYPTMELRHPATTGGYNGIRYTNTSGNTEWFAGTNQTASNAADFVFQGYDRGGSTYREMARIHDSGSITAPNQVGFRARGSRGAWIQGATTTWNVLTSANTGNASAGVMPIGLTIGGDNHVNGYNVGSCFNVSNGRFTAPIAGKYQVYGSAYCGKSAVNTTSYMHFLVYVNLQQVNEIYTIGGNNHDFAHDFSLNFSTILYLEAQDYVDWRIYTYDANVQVYGNHCSIGAHLLS